MTQNYKKYIATIALIWLPCLVLFMASYMLFIRPQNEKRLVTEKQLAQAKRLCEAAEAATFEKTRAELNRRLEELRGKIKDYVVDEKDCAELTFAISKIANEKNVSEFSIHAADGSPATTNTAFNQIYEKHIAVDFTSEFNQFAAFLNALERHQPVIFINDFKMARSADKVTGHKISVDLVVLVRKATG